MISLKCSQCGHEIEVSDSLRGREIRCARCGHLLTAKSAEAAKTEIRPSPLIAPLESGEIPLPPSSTLEAATAHTGDGETVRPRPGIVPVASFPFLSAGQDPRELGWFGDYRVLRLLGQGGMGIVFEAIDSVLQRPVALKVMKPEYAQDEPSRQRFLREARAMAAARSDAIVTVHYVGVQANLPFLAMELLHGEPLNEWLKRRGQLANDEILQLGIAISRGLAAAHACGLVHRDIKPANVFLEMPPDALPELDAKVSDDPGKLIAEQTTVVARRDQMMRLPSDMRVKILDFGLVRMMRDPSTLTDPNMVMGSPGYMAPEQVEGKEIDERCDLFSLGCLLYELSTGAPPFAAPSAIAILMAVMSKHPTPPRVVNPDLPAPLAKLIMQLLAKAPQDRPASAREVVTQLEAMLPTRADHGAAAPPNYRLWWWIGLSILALGLVAGALLLVFAN